MLRHWGFRPTLDRYQDSLLLLAALAIGRLIAVGVDGVNGIVLALVLSDVGARGTEVLQSTGIERTDGTLVIHLNLLAFMARWWANTVAGGVLAVPLVALLAADEGLRRRWRAGVPALTLLVAVWIACALAVSADAWRPALLGAALLIVAFAATSLGVGIASATTLVLAMVSATGFALRLGVFSGLSTTEQLEVAWGFLALLAGTGLFLTALLAHRARIRHEVAASVERYRQLFACSPFPIWAQDPIDGRIRLANPAALRTYGYTEAEFLALRGADLRVAGGGGAALSGRSVGARGVIERHRTAAGTEVDFEVTRMNLEFDDGTLQACFAEPLSERVELRLAALTAGDLERFRLGGDLRHRLNPMLLRVSRAAEEFAASVARGAAPDAAQLALITENVSAASALCRRLTRGASPLQGADGDLIAAVRQLPASFADAGPEIQVSVQARAPVDLSIERRDHIYRLAEDAVRAAATRPGARNVRVSLDVSASLVRLRVEDDGDPLDLRDASARLGLRSISSRATAAQGELRIGRGSAGGTAVTFECDQQGRGRAGNEAVVVPPGAVSRPSTVVTTVGPASQQPAMPRPSRRLLLDALLLGLAYVASGAAGLWLIARPATVHASFDPGLALPWVTNGIAVVGLLLRGERLWPAVFIASVAVWRGVAHDPWVTVLFDAAGESLAAVATVALLRRFGFRLSCDRVRDIVVLACAAAAGRSVAFLADALGINVAAMITPLAVTAEMREAFAPASTLFGITRSALEAGSRWWLNGVAGVLLLVPAVTPWSPRLWRELRSRAPEVGAWLLALGTTVVAILVVPLAAWRLPTLALGLVMVTWAAVRVGVTLAAVATLALSLAATAGFILHAGPLAPTDPGEGIGVLWGYIALLVATAQFLATSLAEHSEIANSLERLNRRYRALFDAVPHPVFAYTIADGRIRLANRASSLRYGYASAEFGRLTVADIAPEAHGLPPPPPGTIEPLKYMTRHRARSGESFDVELAVTAVDVDGSPGALCFAIDVSERNRLRSRMLEATDRERRHLARDLHDGLGQVLTGLQLGVSGLKRAVDRGESVPPKNVAFVADAAREAQRTADRVLRGISPLQDTNGDLLEAIRSLADHLPPAYRHHLRVDVAATAPVTLPLESREHLYQIVRECVTNALKHARASEIGVAVGVSAAAIEVSVEDNGIGLDPAAPSSGIGLESLSLRAGVLHGELAVGGRSGGGTVVRCRCPQPQGAE